ncbi:hypothetical protein K3495_g1692 [Podosphaera aphanis]|nr:hypothetical protein K3495_g1692 [Podosphaera aphanis]
MASNPPAECCTIGFRHEGEPTGTSSKIDSIDIYTAEPSTSVAHQNTAILILPDVIGIWQNSKLIADQFAANGYYTLLVDLYNGDPMPLNKPNGFDFQHWLTKGTNDDNPHTTEFVDPIVTKAIAHLQGKGFTKIGGVGYCFGAKYVARFMVEGGGINVGYVAHPSFVEESELSGIKGPFSISAAEYDEIFTVEQRHRSEVILPKTGHPFQINLFSGVVHGYAVRCDPSKKIEKYSKEQAFYQAVQWFNEYLL